jgi:uncharacterized repeat protein (TIGR01451 family)
MSATEDAPGNIATRIAFVEKQRPRYEARWRAALRLLRSLGAGALLGALVACGGGGGGGSPATYTVGGAVTGLTGTVTLQNNGGDALTRTASGAFTFATPLGNGSAYNVTVLTQPSGQTCSVSNGAGTVNGANVGNVQVDCVTNPFSIGGTISGLTGTVVLRNNGGDNLTRATDGAFTFASALTTGSAYNVTVLTHPAGQFCTVSSGTGSVANANIVNVQVDCVTVPTFTVGGAITGLTGTVVLQNNSGDNLSRSANSGFTFPAVVPDNGVYSVTVLTQPAGQTCTVANGSGNVNGANVVNVQVDCVNNPPPDFTVGGAISGLAGTVVLQNNGGDNLSRASNGAFSFGVTLQSGASYSVTVLTQPAGQTCAVTNGIGTVSGANVANVAVSCTNTEPTTFTVGGTISGLSGTVVLQNNGGGNLERSANGGFEFVGRLPNTAPYNVTILAQPAGQVCSVASGAGNVGGANVSNVQVNCVIAPPPLTLAVTLNPDRVRPNEGIVARLHVANRGVAAMNNLVLQARFPVAAVNNSLGQTLLTGGGTCPAGFCDRGELVTWNIGTLNPGEGTTVSMPMVVSAGTPDGTIITVSAELIAGSTQAALASGSVTVEAAGALSLVLEESRNAAAPGAPLMYTLTYGNRSAASLTGTTLSLPLPTGVTFVSASGGGALVGNAVQWTLGTLQASESGRQQVAVTVGGAQNSGILLLADAAQIGGTSAATGAQVARATTATRVRANPTLGLSIEADPDPVRSNEGVRAKLTVSNLSGAAVLGTQLVLRFPTDRVNNSVSQTLMTGGGVCPAGFCDRYELATWNLGTLAAGSGVTVMIPMTVSAGTVGGSLITLEALAFATGVSPTLASHTVVVDNDNALSLALNEDKDAVAPGAALSYALTYGNISGASITGTTLRLPLPSGVTFVSATGGGALVGNAVEWTLATLQASESGRQQVLVNVDGALGNGTLLVVDAAQISGTSATTGPELARANAATRVQANPTLGLSIEADPDPVRSNEGVRAKLTVTNLSGAAVLGTQLVLRYPTDRVNNSVSQTLMTGGGVCPAGFCDRYELATWNLGALAAGSGVTVMIPMVVSAGTAGGSLITLDAMASADGTPMMLASHTVVVDNDNALSLALNEDKDAVAPGGTLGYTLTYGNISAGSITGTTLRLPLPSGVAFVSATGGGALVGNAVEWTLATLQASESARQQVVVSVDGALSNGTLLVVDAAQISGTSATTGPELARANAATRVQAAPTLGLSIEADPDPVRSNEGVRAKLTVTNLSGAAVLGTQLVLRYPTDRVNNSVSQTLMTGGGVCPAGFCDRYELATWNLGTLAAGSGVTVMIPMVVSAGTAGGSLITLDAMAFADGTPTTLTSHTVVVDNDNALSLALEDGSDAVASGGALTYTLSYGNRSAASITGTTLSLPLPAGVAFVSATGGGTLVGNAVQWSLATLPAGASGRVQVVTAVGGSLGIGTVLAVDAARIAGNSATTGPESARATAATRVLGNSPLRLAVSLAPSPIAANQTTTATLTVTNSGSSGLLGVVLQARFPTDRVNNSLSQTLLTGGGTCPAGFCDRYELATWNLGPLAAGASVTVTMPMVVSAGTPAGTLITVEAEVKSDAGNQATASDTARVQ